MFNISNLFVKRGTNKTTIEMLLDHDGRNWVASTIDLTVSAPTLNELDRKVERALQAELEKKQSIEVFMSSNNEVIPMWMRPYMNHYFNRILELPLRYQPE